MHVLVGQILFAFKLNIWSGVTFSPFLLKYDIIVWCRYNAMIFEALSALKDLNGSDFGAIASFIEVGIFCNVMISVLCIDEYSWITN